MKTPIISKKSPLTGKFRSRKLALPSVALACGIAVPAVRAATIDWTGTASTDWAASGNWSGGTPGTSNIVAFNQPFANSPALTAASSAQGLWLASGVGGDVTIDAASAQTLTLVGTGTINAQASAGIYMNDSGNHNLTIGSNAGILLSNNTGFYNQQSAGVLTVSGTLNLNGKTLTIGSGTGSLGAVTISGPISASTGALTVNTASMVTLSSSNAYTGATTVTGGTLAISGAGTLGQSGNSALAIGAGVLDLNGSSQNVAAVTMSGAGTIRSGTLMGTSYTVSTASGTAVVSANLTGASSAFTKTGAGLVVLSGTNTWGGATTVSAGTLEFANTGAIPASPTISATNATIAVSFGGASEFTQSQVNALLASGTLTFGTGAVFSIDTITQSGTFGGNLSMPVGLTKLGANTLTLTGSNSYTGATTIGAGTLAVGSATAIPATTSLVINSGGLDLNGNNLTVTGLSNGSSAGTITDNSMGSGTSTLGFIDYHSSCANSLLDGANGRKLALQLSATSESLSNVWSVNGNSTFSGGLTLTYTGTSGRGLRLYVNPVTTTLTSGTITSSSYGRSPITIGLAPTDRVQLFLTSTTTIYNDIIVNSNVGCDQPGTFRLQTSAFALAGTMTANLAPIVFFSASSGYGATVTGRVTGTNGLIVSANGCTITLSGTNDYSGATTVSAGAFRAVDGVGLPSASLLTGSGGVFETNGVFTRTLGAAAGNVQLTGGASGFSANGAPATIAIGGTASPATLTWGSANFAPSSLTLNDATADSPLTFANSIDLNGGSRTINVNGNTTTVIGSIVNGTGTGSIATGGAGTLVLAGTNTYNGTTTVSSGTLQVGSTGAFPATTTLTANAGVVDLNGFNPTVAALTGSATGLVTTNNGAAVLTVSNNAASTFNGTLADGTGHLGLAKSGTGALILAGSNAYTGATVVNSGTLQIGAGGTTGSLTMTSGISIAAGAMLSLNRTDNYGGNWSLPVSGSGGLTLTAGSLALTGNSLTYTGTTVNTNGILQLGDGTPGHDGVLSNAALVNNNLQVHFNYYGNQTIAYPISGNGTVWQQGPGTVILTATNTPGTLSILSGTVQLGDGTAGHDGALTVSNAIQDSGALAFNTSGSQTLSSSVSGAGSLVKFGPGTLTLSGSNSFTGMVQVLSGTLIVGNSNALAANVASLSGSGNLAFTVTAPTTAGLSGSGIVSAAGVTTLTLNPAAGVTANFTGAITGGTNLTVSGSGTQVLAGTNTWAGTTTLSSGSLKLGSSGAIPSTTTLTLNGGVLDLSANNLTVNTLTAGTSSALVTDNAAASGTSTFAVKTSGTSVVFAPQIADGLNGRKLAVQLSSSTTQLFASAFGNGGSTFSGGYILSGTNQLRIQVGSVTSTGSAGAVTSSNFGTGPIVFGTGAADRVQLMLGATNTTILNDMAVNSALGTDYAGCIRVQTTGNILAGTINAAMAPLMFSTSTTSSLNITGLVTGSNGVAMSTQAANLTVTLSATNNYAGPTVIGSGVLRAVDSVGLPAASLLTGSGGVFETSGAVTRTLGAAAGNVQLTGGVSGFSAYGGAATIAIGGTASPTALTWGSASFAPSTLVLNETTSNNALTFANSIDLNGGSRAINVNANTVTLSGAIGNGTGTGNFGKGGAGTLVLTGTNTYNGTTTLSSGTLQMGTSAAIPATTSLSVNGGVFDLNGNNVILNNLTVGATASTITDNAVGSGTTVVTATNYNANLLTLIADGANGRKVAVVLNSTVNGSENLNNSNNTFSGGLTLAGTNYLRYGLTVSTVGTAGNITSSNFGRGPITIGLTPNDKVQLWWQGATNQTIYNDMVFNSSLGTDTGNAIRLGSTSTLTLAGKLTAGLAPIYLNAVSQTPATTVFSGQITGANGLTMNGNAGVLFVLNNTTANANNYQGTTTLLGGATLQLGAANQIPSGAGCGNVSLTGTLNLAGYNQTINGLTGAGTVDGGSGTPTLTLGANDQTSTFTGKLFNTSGTLSLVKTGTGTITLSGSNSFLGATTINGGILQSSTTGALATTGTVIVNSGGTLAVNFGGANDYTQTQIGTLLGKTSFASTSAAFGLNTVNASGTYSAVLAQPAGLTKLGANTLTLTGSNTYTGATTVGAGMLQSASNAVLATTGTVIVNDGATLAVNFGGANDYTQAQIGTLLGKTSFATTNAAFAFNTANASGTYGAVLAQPAGLTKLGANTLTLTGSNPYTGATTVSSGTLQIGAGGTVGSIASTSGAGLAASTALVFNRTDDYGGAFGAVINGAGAVTLTTGTLTLSGSNSYTGMTTVNGGVLKPGSNLAFNDNGTLNVNAGATFDLNGYNARFSGTSANSGTITNSGTSVKTLTFDAAGALSGTFTGANLALAINTGASTTVQDVRLPVATTFGGGITLSSSAGASGGATLRTTSAYHVGSGTITVGDGLASNERGQVWINASGYTLTNNLVISATAGVGSGGSLGLGNVRSDGVGNVVSGLITANQDLILSTYYITPATLSVSGRITGTGGLQIFCGNLSGTGWNTTTLNNTGAANDYAGNTSVALMSTLKLGANNQIPNGAGKGNVTVSAGGVLDMNGMSDTINGLAGSGTVDIVSASGTTSTLTVGDNGQSSVFGGVIMNTTGTLALVKTGAGALTLGGSNTFKGGTTVVSGTLQAGNANALGSATGALAVNGGVLNLYGNSLSAGALSGSTGAMITNTVSGTNTLTTTVSGTSTYAGSIANGAGAVAFTKSGSGTLILSGSLTMAGLNANAGVTQLAQSGSIGAVSVAAGATLSMAAHSGSTYNVLNVSSLTISGFASGLALANVAAIDGTAYTYVDTGSQGRNYGVLTDKGTAMAQTAGATGDPAPASPESVPEPGALGMLLAGASALLGFRRKAKRSVR